MASAKPSPRTGWLLSTLPQLSQRGVRSRNSGSHRAAARSYSLKVRPGHFCARLCPPPAALGGWPLDLALEDAQLVLDDHELHPAAGVPPVTSDSCIEQQTEGGNQESVKYGRPSWLVGPLPCAEVPPVPRS